MSIRRNINESRKELMNTKAEESQTNLTPNSQPELFTQDTPQPSPRVEELNNLIDEMNIEKNPQSRESPNTVQQKREPISRNSRNCKQLYQRVRNKNKNQR